MATSKPLNVRRFISANKKILRFAKNKLPKLMLEEFKKNTPRGQTGNAKRNTKLKKKRNGFEILGDYNYSGVIDRGEYPNPPKQGTGKTRGGYSTQAPKGMVDPTLDYGNKKFAEYIRRNS